MKSDLDAIMDSRDLDALVVVGPAYSNPAMVYLTGGAHLSEGLLVKKRGEAALLFHQDMERDEAAKTGLRTRRLAPITTRLAEAKGDMLLAMVTQWKESLAEAGVLSGRVSINGRVEVGPAFEVLRALEAALPGLELVGEVSGSALEQAMATKDEAEVARIRAMGAITTEIAGLVAESLTAHRAENGVLVKPDGDPLTVGEVKSQIGLWLAERGAESPEDIIFAVGRDAGVPHSVGSPGDLISVGQTIIFDIFLRESGGGYYYDFTRTWCLGFAPDDVLAIYEDVLGVYLAVTAALKTGELCQRYQELACELFETGGHPTSCSDPDATDGYVHGVGHGLGLRVHERPSFRQVETNQDRLEPGMVFTIEPGLYYPERGMGVRLEDVFWVSQDGQMENLATYPLDLVLPLKG